MPKHNFLIQTHVNDFLNLLAQREFELANYLRGRYEDLRDIMSHYRAVKQLECQGAEYLKDFTRFAMPFWLWLIGSNRTALSRLNISDTS